MREVWTRLERWLEANARPMLGDLRPPAQRNKVVDVGVKLGVTFPEDFVDSYLIHDGQVEGSAPLVRSWELLSLDKIVSEARHLRDSWAKAPLPENVGDPDGPVKPLWWSDKWIPFGSNSEGDYACLDFDPDPGGQVGQIISYRHDDSSRKRTAPSLKAWLESYADELEKGKYRYEDDMLIKNEEK